MKRFVRLAVLVACAALAVHAPGAGAQTTRFSLDDVLAAPFVDGLASSPHHDALVWTVHERGARNVVVALADGAARQVTNETADDGEELSGAQLTPNDAAVVYERGGAGQDGGGDNPNPASPAKPAMRRIMLTAVAGGATIDLGVGREPQIAPQGDRVAWIDADRQLSVATIASADGGRTWTAGKPEKPFVIRGKLQAPVWSPDGARISVESDRGDHAFVAIYSFADRSIVYAAPGFGNDGAVAWSPDGARVAFVRAAGMPSNLTGYDDPSRFAPWSIVVADARTGKGGIVWRAPSGRGSEFTIADGVQPLWWSRNGDLAFVWERDDRWHLYALRGAAGTPRLMTPGAFDVEQIAAGVDGTSLLYTSNAGDADERHVWRVAFAGGAPQRVTNGPTNQWSPVDLPNRVAYIDASYATPGTVTVAAPASAAPHQLAAAPLPASFPTLVKPKLLVYRAPDGTPIHAQLFTPAGGGKHPALLFVHGGPERQMLGSFHYFEAYTDLYELNQYLVNRGFVVLSINYRSGIMYGHDFREAPKRGLLGASEYQDVLAGARVLGSQPNVDRKRLGIYGLSYGGYLTALALARNSDVFAAGADQAGVHDWRAFLDSDAGHEVGTPAQRAVAFAASPMAGIATWRSPVFVSQGDDDRNVPFDQGVELVNALQARGIAVTTSAVPNELHEFTTYANESSRFAQSAEFLERALGAR